MAGVDSYQRRQGESRRAPSFPACTAPAKASLNLQHQSTFRLVHGSIINSSLGRIILNPTKFFKSGYHSSTLPGHGGTIGLPMRGFEIGFEKLGRRVGLPMRGFEIGFEKLGRRGYDSTQATMYHAPMYEARGGLVLNLVQTRVCARAGCG
eukprot:402560-Rhodomonas_salina.1